MFPRPLPARESFTGKRRGVETSLPWQQERGPASASFCDECGPLRPVPVPCFLGKGYGLLQGHCPSLGPESGERFLT